MSYIADVKKGGYLPLQHHSYAQQGIQLDLRSIRKAVRIEERMLGNDEFGHYVIDKLKTVGDVLGPVLWPHIPTKREIPAWWYAAPGAIEKVPFNKLNIKALPFGDKTFERDDRFDFLRSHVSCEFPRLPKGFHGLTVSATKETAQEELFMPTDPRMIAANIAGEGKYGSVVCDLTPDNRIDLSRVARIQTVWRVIRPRKGCVPLTIDDPTAPPGCPPDRQITKTQNAIAWQLGRNGREKIPGFGYCYDLETNPPNFVPQPQHGRFFEPSAEFGAPVEPKQPRNPTVLVQTSPPVAVIGCAGVKASGPLAVGLRDDKHKIGITQDGEPINALHIQTEAYFLRDKLRDGPIDFENVLFRPVLDGPALQRGHVRFDPTVQHDFICGPRDGKWRVQVASVFEIPDIITPRNPIKPEPIITPRPNAPRDPGDPHEGMAATTIQTAVPRMLFQAQSPDRGSLNLKPVPSPDRQDVEDVQSRAPITMAIEAWGHYVEDKAQYTEAPCTGRYRPGTASGGIIILPPELDMQDAASGFVPEDALISEAFVVFPQGANLAFAEPDTTTGDVKLGHNITTDGAGTTTFSAVDSAGAKTSLLTLTPTNVSIAGGFALPSFSQGSILYVGPGSVVAEDNVNLVWDTTALRTARVDIGFGSAAVLSPKTFNVQGDQKLYHASSGGTRTIATGRSVVAGAGDTGVGLLIATDAGTSSNTNGGAGGLILVQSGAGGAALAGGTGGNGATIQLTGGAGGSSVSGTAGQGGQVIIQAGSPGAGLAAVNGSDVTIDASGGLLGGTDGDVKIGGTTGGVKLGRTGLDVLALDRLLVNTSTNLPTAGSFTKFQVAADSGTTGAVAVFGNNVATDPLTQILTNGSGSTQLFIAGNVNDFMPGTAAGDGGMRVNASQDMYFGDSGLTRLVLQSGGAIIVPDMLGVGSSVTPTVPLDVTGDATISGKAGIGVTATHPLHVNTSPVSSFIARVQGSLVNNSDVGLGVTPTFSGLSASSTVFGTQSSLVNTSTQTGHMLAALQGSMSQQASGGSVTEFVGVQGIVGINDPAGGAVIDAYGLHAKQGSTFYRATRATGLRVENFGGLGTTARGLWIADITGATTNWAISSEGGDSYHVGSLRLGSTVAPAEKLDVTGNVKLSGELMGCRQIFPGATNDDVSAGRYLEFIDGVTMQATLGYRMHRAGSIVGMSQQFNVTGAGSNVRVVTQARINGTNVFSTSKAMGSSTGIDGSSATQARGTDTFVAGDILTLYLNIVFFLGAPTVTDICSFVEVVYDD